MHCENAKWDAGEKVSDIIFFHYIDNIYGYDDHASLQPLEIRGLNVLN